MGDVYASKWAPSSIYMPIQPSPNLRRSSVSNPELSGTRRSQKVEIEDTARAQDLARFNQLLRRLKWKSTFLLIAHQRAQLGQTDNVICNTNFPISSIDGKANAAEIMFKHDFFEYYALLERTLVALLGVFGMHVQAEYGSTVTLPPTKNGLEASNFSDDNQIKKSIVGDSRAFHGYSHRFHANLLAAFDNVETPLHPILGTGKVREYLGVAKEFRNRWKEVDEASNGHDLLGLHKRYQQILKDLQLDNMLATLLQALDQCRALVHDRLHIDAEVEMNDDLDINVEDAMDWD